MRDKTSRLLLKKKWHHLSASYTSLSLESLRILADISNLLIAVKIFPVEKGTWRYYSRFDIGVHMQKSKGIRRAAHRAELNTPLLKYWIHDWSECQHYRRICLAFDYITRRRYVDDSRGVASGGPLNAKSRHVVNSSDALIWRTWSGNDWMRPRWILSLGRS